VETFAPKAGRLGDGRHAARLGHVREGGQQNSRVRVL
jgi:hypothetical protein